MKLYSLCKRMKYLKKNSTSDQSRELSLESDAEAGQSNPIGSPVTSSCLGYFYKIVNTWITIPGSSRVGTTEIELPVK